jgi:ubiquitin C-terminal hydrolase
MSLTKSMMQCLFNCKSFSDLIASDNIHEDINENNDGYYLYYATKLLLGTDDLTTFDSTINALIKINKLTLSDDKLTKPTFTELLSVYLIMLHQGLSYPVNIHLKPYVHENPLINTLYKIQLKSLMNYGDYINENDSKILKLLTYQITTANTCKQCQHISYQFDINNILNLPVSTNQNVSLRTLMDNYIYDDTIIHRCPKCNQETETLKKSRFTCQGDIIIINLDKDTKDTKVIYPKILDIDEYKLFPGNDGCYRLMSIGCYNQDTNLTYSICCQDGKWIKYTDDNQEQLDNYITPDAYCLFYQHFIEKLT